MNKILIKKILNKEKVAKSGKTYLACSILTVDKNGVEQWLNGFGNETTKSWRDGQTVELEIYQEEYNGEVKLKFKEPPERNLYLELDKINAKLDILLGNQGKKDEISVEECEKAFAKDAPDFLQ